MRDEVDERLYCNGPPEPMTQTTVPKNVPFAPQREVLHVQIVRYTPQSKYQLQWIPREEAESNYSSGGIGGMYWDKDGRPFANVEQYRNWLDTGVVESDHQRANRENLRQNVANRNNPNNLRQNVANRNNPNKPTSISGCAKDNWFWIMIGMSGTLITVIITNHQLGWIPLEVFAELSGGFVFYMIWVLAHFIPLLMIFLGAWGVKSYCSTISCDRDHFIIVLSMALLTAGILLMYSVFNHYLHDGFNEFWETKDSQVESLLNHMRK